MTKREQFLVFIMGFIGVPYIWGGSSIKKGLDCSGLVQMLLERLHLDPPGDQTADALMRLFKKGGDYESVEVSVENSSLGDLVFYGTKAKATHIAMALGDGLMVEAGGGGSKCTTIEIARKLGAQVRVATIKRRSDLICILRPTAINFS